MAGANAADFPLVKAKTFANGLFYQYLGGATFSNRDEFVQKLDKGIKELQSKVGKQAAQ